MDTWWIWYASAEGSVAAFVANSLLMALVYLLYFSLRKRIQRPIYSIWILVPVWLAFEYLHTKWDLAWTWLSLGNAFAFEHNWVQWYEFTGVSGGAAWILAVNILLYQVLKFKIQHSRVRIIAVVLVVLIPIGISRLIKYQRAKQILAASVNVLIVQPNIDPYNDKFSGNFEEQLQGVYNKIKGKITTRTKYVVLPETFLTESIWENDLDHAYSIQFIKDSLIRKFPNLTIIVGATTFYRYAPNQPLSATARAFDKTQIYYDVYNTAIQINKSGIQLYHKSKLVPGVERMPYPALFKPLEELAINLGGTFGSLGTQEERTVFFNEDKSIGKRLIEGEGDLPF